MNATHCSKSLLEHQDSTSGRACHFLSMEYFLMHNFSHQNVLSCNFLNKPTHAAGTTGGSGRHLEQYCSRRSSVVFVSLEYHTEKCEFLDDAA